MIEQLDEILSEYQTLVSRSQHDDLSGLPDKDVIRLTTRSRASIERLAGKGSVYYRQAEEIIQHGGYSSFVCRRIIGVVDSLRADVNAGYLKSHEELIHSELFSDFLEMARHLISEGYKDPAAVIAGSALESHLRNLCNKANIETTFLKNDREVNKKADKLNSDLAKKKIYSKLDQKNVTAWLGLRNKAAHGHYDEYTKDQVVLLIESVANFIIRNPA